MIALLLALGCGGALSSGVLEFERGDLPAATAAFESAADSGAPSGAVWFDLGTTWYLRGDLPRAVACWRSAARLRPRDAAVQHDLAVARVGLPGTPPPVGESLPWFRLATPGEVGLLGSLFAGMGSLLLVRARRIAGSARAGGLWWAVGVALGLLGMQGAYVATERPVAVVLDGELRARLLADPASAERFRLPPGSEVRVEQRLGDWVLVRDGRERRGWVAAAGLHLVAPASPPPRRLSADSVAPDAG